MQTLELKITKIGNSRGVRIPAGVLQRYAFTDAAVMIENMDGILLRPKQQADVKMSWADTARAMAASSEDWSAWDGVSADGLDSAPWLLSEGSPKKRDTYCVTPKKPRRKRQ